MSEFVRRRHACVVLGMHRSGTSALTQLLAALGGNLPLGLNPPAPDNPEGYFEPAALVAIHDDLLSAGGSAWFDPKPFSVAAVERGRAVELMEAMAAALAADYGTASLALIKDPRMCRFFPLAREVLAVSGMDCSVVLALRPPAEVAASLGRRDQMSAAYAGLLWARHVIGAERNSRDLPRITVTYEDMLADWRATAERIRTLPGPWSPSDPDQAPVKAEMRHHSGLTSVGTFGPRLGPLLDELHAALAALAVADGDEQHARVDAAGGAVLAAAGNEADLFEAEFLHRRLSTDNPFWRSPDPKGDRQALAAILDRLHGGGEVEQ